MSGDYDEDGYEPTHDLSVLHRWELLHMIWEPIALGASGRVLSVLFRVLPPGRTLRMSMSAVAREAAVVKSTVARVYANLRAGGIVVTAPDGKPAVNYSKALDAAIRSVVSRPPGERERRLARLQEIASALGTSVNMKYIDARLAEFDIDPTKRLPGRQTREQNPYRVHVATDRVQLAPARVHVATDRVHVAPGPGARCDTELNSNGKPNLNLELKVNGTPEGDASGPPGVLHAQQYLGPIQAEYGGKPTLLVRVLDHVRAFPNGAWSRAELAEDLDVPPVRIGQALKTLCERGHAERVGHGRYVFEDYEQ